MTKLSDTQIVILSAAARRDSLSLYPLPVSLRSGGGLEKALAALISRGLIEERETADPVTISREDGDYRFGLFVTAAGLAAIGVEVEGSTIQSTAAEAPSGVPAKASKTSIILGLLDRIEGATLAELIAATDWLPHTTRAALTGLRKKNHAIERGKRGDETCYFLRAA